MTSSSSKPVGCVYCNTAPTPHLLIWIDTAISLFFDRPLRTACKPLVILVTPFVRWLTDAGMHVFFSISHVLGLVKFSDENVSSEMSRKKVMFQEAKHRGVRMQIILFLGKELSYTRALLPLAKYIPLKVWQYFEFIPIPPWKDSPLWQNLDNKIELKRLFEKNGLRVPKGEEYMSVEAAVRTFKELKVPVIVKPLEGSRARHTRVRVTTEDDFKDAFMRALEVCPLALVEEFVEGDVHRITCVDGKFIAAMRFVRPTIEADGTRTVHELRNAYNAKLSLPEVMPVKDDELFAVTLSHQGLTSTSIPRKGMTVRLADFSERVNGGYNEDVTDRISHSRKAYFEKAAKVTRLPLVGFDIVSLDIADDTQEAVFLEANTAPFIEIHQTPTKGIPRNVAAPVWDLWLSKRNQ